MSEKDKKSLTPDRRQNLDDRNSSQLQRSAPQSTETTEVDEKKDQIRDQFSGDRTERGPGQKEKPGIIDPNDDEDEDLIERDDDQDEDEEDAEQSDPNDDEEIEE